VENGLTQGKWLLYLTDPVEISPPGIGQCFLNPRHVNFLGLRKRTEALSSEEVGGPRTRAEKNNSFKANAVRPALDNSITGSVNKDDLFNSGESEDKIFSTFSSSSYSYSSSSSSSSRTRSWQERTVSQNGGRWSQAEEEEVYSARVRRATKQHALDSEGRASPTRHAKERVQDSDKSAARTRPAPEQQVPDSDEWAARTRRATEHVVEPDHVLDSEGRVARVVVFDCGRETAKCLTISCSIPALPRGAHAIVRLRYNSFYWICDWPQIRQSFTTLP
jgi:hypothetical protein